MDDKSKKGPQDAARINVNEDYELRYWSDKFGLSPDKLKEVVADVGVSVKAVEEYLKNKK